MARQTSDSSDTTENLSKLKDDIDALRDDLSSLTETIKAMGNSAVADAQSLGAEKLEELRAEIERASGEARLKGEQSIAEIERTVQERPLMSLLAAFGAGMLIARLMNRG